MAKNSTKAVGTKIVDFDNLQDKIYTVRGVQVMLDYDLAEIYGYTTSAFNQQVSRNVEKFDEDFRFQLTKEDLEALNLISQNVISSSEIYGSNGFSRSQNVILNPNAYRGDEFLRSQNVILNEADFSRSKKLILNSTDSSRSKNLTLNDKRGSNVKYLPYAFTEQGIYMLMTVLKGDLATKQSKALIRAFHAMKTYIANNQGILKYKSELGSLLKLVTNAKDIEQIKTAIKDLNTEVKAINQRLSNALMKTDISPILLDFNNAPERKEFLLLNGELAKASETYIDIYARAKQSVYIVDDYVDIKTLRHLQKVKQDVKVTIFTDNVGKYLRARDYRDFCLEFPQIKANFIKTKSLVHDRFIILDYGTKTERIFHCGASSKDAGARVTVISEFSDNLMRDTLHKVVDLMLTNPELVLK